MVFFFKMRNNFHSSRRKKMCLVVKVPYAKKPQVSLCYYLHESSFSHMVNFEIRSPSSSTTSILRAGEGRKVSRLKNVKQFVHFGKLHTTDVAANFLSYHKKLSNMHARNLQGDPNQNLKCLLAIPLKLCISDPMLVKPKCV